MHEEDCNGAMLSWGSSTKADKAAIRPDDHSNNVTILEKKNYENLQHFNCIMIQLFIIPGMLSLQKE